LNQVQDLWDLEYGFQKFIFVLGNMSSFFNYQNEFYEDYDLNKNEDPDLKAKEQLRDAVKSVFSVIQNHF